MGTGADAPRRPDGARLLLRLKASPREHDPPDPSDLGHFFFFFFFLSPNGPPGVFFFFFSLKIKFFLKHEDYLTLLCGVGGTGWFPSCSNISTLIYLEDGEEAVLQYQY